jgi:predicted alpha/beta hydrolase family esterase
VNGAAHPRILVLPGLGGSGPAHWQTLWERRDPRCVRVEQRDWDRPERAEWIATLDEAVSAHAGPALLVAHSLACALVAHWARDRRASGAVARVAGALLVAPADVDAPERTPPETRSFAPLPREPLPFRATVVASHDDPFVALERARELAAAWGAAFVDAGARGHLNAASGLGDWPEGWRHVEALLASMASAR